MNLFNFIFDKKFLLTEKKMESINLFQYHIFFGQERIFDNLILQEFANRNKGKLSYVFFISKDILFTFYEKKYSNRGVFCMFIKSKKNNNWIMSSVETLFINDEVYRNVHRITEIDDLFSKYGKLSATTSILELYKKMFRISDINNDVHIKESVFKSSMCTSLISIDRLIDLEKRLKNSRETYIKKEIKKSYLFFSIKIPTLVVNFLFKTILRKNKKSLMSYLNNEFKLIRDNRINKIEIKNYGI